MFHCILPLIVKHHNTPHNHREMACSPKGSLTLGDILGLQRTSRDGSKLLSFLIHIFQEESTRYVFIAKVI